MLMYKMKYMAYYSENRTVEFIVSKSTGKLFKVKTR